MGIDISYRSFSPSLADRRWPKVEIIKEKFDALRKVVESSKSEIDDYYQKEEQEREINIKYNAELKQISDQVFKYFKDKKYYLKPYGGDFVEWPEEKDYSDSQDEYLMECLMAGFPVYSKEESGYLLISDEMPGICEKYEEKKKENRQALIEINKTENADVDDQKSAVKRPDEEIDEDLEEFVEKIFVESSENDLYGYKRLDLEYGGEVKVYLEHPKVEYVYIDALTQHFDFPMDGRYPTKESWVRIFEDIKKEDIEKMADVIMQETGWEKEESYDALADFLKEIKPVIQDLKETEDSILVVDYYDLEVDPESSEKLLTERAKKHLEMYKNVIGDL